MEMSKTNLLISKCGLNNGKTLIRIQTNKKYKKFLELIPCKRDYMESSGHDGCFTILPKKNALDDFIKQYWNEKFSKIKNFSDLWNFICK